MGLERRGNSIYYYRKERTGKRVTSTYVGKGELATLIRSLDQIEREEKNEGRIALEREKRDQRKLDETIEGFCAEAQAMEQAIFLISGYRTHSRQWRRKQK